jgi:TRAP transporter TAXI family solute receptor
MRTLLAVLALLIVGNTASAQESIVILTGSTSGVYYPLGNALSAIVTKTIPKARASVQVTQGSIENLRLLNEGDGEIAFTLGDSLSDAWRGNAEAGFKSPLKNLRGVAAIYRNYIQLVASTSSGVRSLADLKGKRVSVGPRQSGTELNARAVLGAAGISYADLGRVEYLPFGQSAKMIEKGELDATLQSAGLGVDSIRQLSSAVSVLVVPIPPDVVAKIGNPVYVTATIPARTYEGQAEDVPTASVGNFLATREGVSTDTVYSFTKALFGSLDQLVDTHPAAKGVRLEQALTGMPLPLHPGAQRYYREAGLLK